ncbi:ribonuclease 4 [Myotis lucifugus]|uniref:Ribonuclease 4 n=1 Tax=Myotis lucifugus TaxID=59463 RepID=W0UVJ3_MYOLU|nr:ribonuclease 4 [Myotis lucifugus]CDG32123.1 TPA: ribonuclease A B3 [Myotis lucifugus]
MALQKTLSLLLLSLLTLLGLGLVQPSYGETMHQRFLREHVDSNWTGGNNWYCNTMMQRRGMTRPRCKQLNTFIHADIGTIKNICRTPNIRCKNGRMNCHGRHVRVTECSLTASSQRKCSYQGRGRSRRVVIACQGNPPVPVRFDK